jgi:tripartite-type tricarboxylate transporter receptor subunit TctC
MPFACRASLATVAVAACAMSVAPGFMQSASAQSAEEFFKSKSSIEIIIGYPPAGSNDVYSRLLSRHLGKHLPGKPTVIPRNMPGAGSFVALNHLFNIAPKDGSVIGLGAPTASLDERLGTTGVRFKTAEFNWIGRIDSLINMVFMWHTSKVQSIADAQKIESTLSGTGAGSTVSIYPNAINNVLGTKFKLIMGYKGSAHAQLAVERGEVEGHSTSWTALKVGHPDWIRDKKVKVIVQFSVNPHPELKDVPTAPSLARNDEERKILTAIVNASEVGTAFMAPPGVPADRVALLRRAFDATMKDPEFIADAEKMKLTLGPNTGAELQKTVAEVSGLQGDLLERVRAAYTADRK